MYWYVYYIPITVYVEIRNGNPLALNIQTDLSMGYGMLHLKQGVQILLFLLFGVLSYFSGFFTAFPSFWHFSTF